MSRPGNYFREMVCKVCGQSFMGGCRAFLCPVCMREYKNRKFVLKRCARQAGEVDLEECRRQALEYVRQRLGERPSPQVAPVAHCLYCDRVLTGAFALRGYCPSCVAQGLHWLHEVTGRTARGRP
ncbi:MAG: hypothetical protein J6V72_09255 [Kiritimatiellae bacterium]|nr:hypothetical protein [Kiritimatiellia bacterium]